MARGKSKTRSQSRGQRDTSVISSVASPLLASYEPLDLWHVEDNRRWFPDKRPLTVWGARPRIVIDNRSLQIGNRYARFVVHRRPFIAYGKPLWAHRGLPRGVQLPVGTMFESPFRVIRCIRRKVRREVIFARKKQRKGAGAKHRRMDFWSRVGC